MSKPIDYLSLPPELAEVTIIPPKISGALTSLSQRQQDRLEAAGTFPRSVKLGSGRNGRKGRVLSEILAWNRARIADRDRLLDSEGNGRPPDTPTEPADCVRARTKKPVPARAVDE